MKAVVLASGGLDSTVCAALAKQEGCHLYFLTLAYGQRHEVEVERARLVGKALNVLDHVVLTLDLRAIGGSALTGDCEVPYDRSELQRGRDIPPTYVPARNTILLSLALAYAETLSAQVIYFGANVMDYSGYPDCRPEFLQAFERVGALGTRVGVSGSPIEIRAPLLQQTKAEIIHTGMTLKVPFQLTHSCYAPTSDGLACGRCDSCLIRRAGFRDAGVVDPVGYVPG